MENRWDTHPQAPKIFNVERISITRWLFQRKLCQVGSCQRYAQENVANRGDRVLNLLRENWRKLPLKTLGHQEYNQEWSIQQEVFLKILNPTVTPIRIPNATETPRRIPNPTGTPAKRSIPTRISIGTLNAMGTSERTRRTLMRTPNPVRVTANMSNLSAISIRTLNTTWNPERKLNPTRTLTNTPNPSGILPASMPHPTRASAKICHLNSFLC